MHLTAAILNVVIIAVFISISFLFKIYYPKEINSLIGYRTKRSMASQENRLLANRYASGLLFKCSLVLIPVSLFLYFLFDSEIALFGVLASFIALLIYTIIKTERKLKQQEGSRMENKMG